MDNVLFGNFRDGVVRIKFVDIDPVVGSYRRDYVESVRASIESVGLLKPFVLFRDNLGKLVIIDGHIRYLAIKDMNPDIVPAVLITGDICDDVEVICQWNKFKPIYGGRRGNL